MEKYEGSENFKNSNTMRKAHTNNQDENSIKNVLNISRFGTKNSYGTERHKKALKTA